MGFSRFFLCDLQVHTPSDRQHRYGEFGSREPNPEAAEVLVRTHADAGVEVLAVTDHNRVDWYPTLRDAGRRHGVYVFPGLEFSVNGCHLLTIWDANEQGYDLAQRFVQSLRGPGESLFEANGDPKPVASGQVLDLAESARKHWALVFAPHSTARGMGLFASGVCRNSRDVAQSSLVLGFDVFGNPKADVLANPRSEFGNIPPRWFISGDTRSLAEVGKRAVYLKLGSEPTLEGLRQAFLVPQTRIRFPAALRPQWSHVKGVQFLESPAPSWPRVKRVEIRGGFHSDLQLDVAPGLTALIGGKGTGKSTFVEILRYALDAGGPISDEAVGNLRHNFRANAEARVWYVDASGDEYEVRRSGDESAARLLRGGRETDVPVQRRVSVRVFGQRELQELAKRKDLLREFVASQAGSDWDQALVAERAHVATLRDVDTNLASLETSLTRMSEYANELADTRDKLAIAAEKGLAELIQQSKKLGAVDRSVKTVAAWPGQVRRTVDQLGVLADAIRTGSAAVEELGCSTSTAAKLVALPPLAARRLEETDVPDDIAVEIDLGSAGSESWTNVEEVSPGQRATALLALALASGSEPLVIDQPEDDLDNRYIYDEVVKVLGEICQTRQVIVATHNANIPVLGDAELVVALNADAGRSSVLACGGLEDPQVAEEARRILEGGDEAFKARHRRYLAAG